MADYKKSKPTCHIIQVSKEQFYCESCGQTYSSKTLPIRGMQCPNCKKIVVRIKPVKVEGSVITNATFSQ